MPAYCYASGMQPAQVLHDRAVSSYASDKASCHMALGSLMISAAQDSKLAETLPDSQLAGNAASKSLITIVCCMQWG